MLVKRAVAFLDILGFRKLVTETPLSELGPRFANVIEAVRRDLNRPPLPGENLHRLLKDRPLTEPFCLTYAFSDSVILISDDSSSTGCLAVLVFAVRAMQAMMASGFPVRAGVSFGEMFVDIPRAVFLGRALTTAYDSEQSQDWVGGLVDDTVAEAVPELAKYTASNMLLNTLFPVYPVPLKTGTVRECRTLNWRWNLVVKSGTRSLFHETSDPEAMKKITNALAYAKWIRAAGLAYPADPASVPVEVRRFFVGDELPPPSYIHGDEW